MMGCAGVLGIEGTYVYIRTGGGVQVLPLSGRGFYESGDDFLISYVDLFVFP